MIISAEMADASNVYWRPATRMIKETAQSQVSKCLAAAYFLAAHEGSQKQ